MFELAVTGPITEVADTFNHESDAGFTVNVLCLVVRLKLAVMFTATGDVTAVGLIVNRLLDIAPAATVTDAGTAATTGLSLVSDTATPPAGAGRVQIDTVGPDRNSAAHRCGR